MSSERVHVIACGVLAIDLRHIGRELNLDLQATFLPGGLHSNPAELRRKLQQAVDEVSAAGQADQIAIGYGVCGRGAVGIHARHVPLAIPRVHDCIALFLGSDAAYRQQFAKYPGTYYLSAGWVNEKVQPISSDVSKGQAGPDKCDCNDPEFVRLVDQHGNENAQAVREFLSSWQKNYQRAAFIDTGAEGRRTYAGLAQEMAARHGWKYEELPGSGELLKKLLTARMTTDEILLVPPHHVTVYDAVKRGLTAVPIWQVDQKADGGRDEVIEVDGGEGSTAEGGRPKAEGSETNAPAFSPQPSADKARLGLGIDAGGTYTDVVLYDFASDRVIQKAKGLTTKWDYTIGISEALDQLEASRLAEVDLVSLSTTLATNATVEGRGQTVGLLVMPPYGLFTQGDIDHSPLAVISGRLEITGEQLRPVDHEQVRAIARKMVAESHVGAFAVAGFASSANSAHENEVRRILQEETGLTVTCGHDVSDQLDYSVRAQTAALNARIIPCLVAFLDQAGQCLRARGITAPIMVVRSDGSLMSVATARQRPIETILCGPAASVAGARYLAKVPTAFVVDVGGTTTDTARIEDGVVRTTPHGARVGGWQTHVQALDMRTTGLGGDSLIQWTKRELKIGPRRVAPVAWLSQKVVPPVPSPAVPPKAEIESTDTLSAGGGTGGTSAGTAECFAWIERHLGDYATSPAVMDIYAINSGARIDGLDLTPRERKTLDNLARRPHSAMELSARVCDHWWEVLDISRLEQHHIVHRAGLTPTDLLHATGEFVRWDRDAATRLADLFARAMEIDRAELARRVKKLFVGRLAIEVLKKELDEETKSADEIDRCEICQLLLNKWQGVQTDEHDGLEVGIKLKHPVIGIGAPVHLFLPAAAKLLQTEVIIPPDADVANAIGAITSSVVIRRQLEISPDASGRYALAGMDGAPTFAEYHAARTAALDWLATTVAGAAKEAGTDASRIRFTIHDNVAPTADGGMIFISQTIEARLSGRPDLRRLSVLA